MKTWWDIYGKDRRLHIVLGQEDKKIIGIAPFSMLPKRKRAKFLPYKTMHYLCTGTVGARNTVSDYLDFIVRRGRRKEFTAGVLHCLAKNPEWDELLIDNVSSESDLVLLIKEETAKQQLNFEVIDDRPSVLIKLPGTWEDFLGSIGSGLRYKISRGRREFEKLNGTYERIRDKSALDDAFADLERLHQHRWHTKGESGAFSDPKWHEFHKRFIPIAHQNGWLRLSFLRLNGEAVAANYSFAFDGKIHFFQSGLIPHENKKIRLGLILHSYCIEEAIKEGSREYDFLRVSRKGAGYKDIWGNYNRPLYDLRVSRRTIKETLYQHLKKLGTFRKS